MHGQSGSVSDYSEDSNGLCFNREMNQQFCVQILSSIREAVLRPLRHGDTYLLFKAPL